MTTELSLGIGLGIGFIVLGLVAIILQVRKMKNIHTDFLKDMSEDGGVGVKGVFSGLMPIMICGFLSTGCLIGSIVSFVMHVANTH